MVERDITDDNGNHDQHFLYVVIYCPLYCTHTHTHTHTHILSNTFVTKNSILTLYVFDEDDIWKRTQHTGILV